MPILDANGNPVTSSDLPPAHTLVRDPVDLIPPIPDEHLKMVLGQCNDALRAGMEPNAPIGVDIGLLASLARTVRDQRISLRNVAHDPTAVEISTPENAEPEKVDAD